LKASSFKSHFCIFLNQGDGNDIGSY